MHFSQLIKIARVDDAPVSTSGTITTDKFVPPIGEFEAFIELDAPMTVLEAVRELAGFHQAPEENVLDVFSNLKNNLGKEGYTAIFSKSVSCGNPCLKVEISDENGKWVANSLINQFTGQQIPHVS